MSSVEWEALPLVVRRSFDVYLTEFQAKNAGARLGRVGVPRQEGDDASDFAIPYEDAASGTRYEVAISPAGAVGATRQIS